MPQRYKLRLGDGTFMTVDLEGLQAWVGDRRAVVQAVGSQQWRPLVDVLAEEQQQAKLLRALIRPDAQPRKPATPAPAPPPQPSPSPWETPAAAAPWEPAPSSPAWEPPAPAPAWEPPAPAPAWEPPPAPEPAPAWEPPPPPPAPAWEPPVSPSSFGDSSFGQPTRFDEPSPFGGPALGSGSRVQALADEPASSDLGRGDDLPAIPLKPLDEAPTGFKSAWSDDDGPAGDGLADDEELRRGRLDGPLLTVLESVGGFLSRLLGPLAPRLRGLRGRSQAEESSDAVAGVEDLDDLAGPDDERPSLVARVSGWLGSLRPRSRADRQQDEAEEEEEEVDVPRARPRPAPAAATPAARRAARPEPLFPSEPVEVAPPPVSSLPVVPLAPSREPRERHDVYDGDEGFSISLGPLWQWTKAIVLWGALIAAVAYTVIERRVWFPKAADVGQVVFNEVDRQVLSREREQKQREALTAAAVRLPGLAPETILLVFARNPQGIEEAPEVFQVTREAAERGRGALAPEEAAELSALERELVATLSNTERARVAEYDRTRERRVIFSFENPFVMDLVARGARALPADKLARLQALTHQAVVAGIDRPAASPSAAP